MLYVRPKISEMGMHLLGRSVHPELYETCAARVVERELYRLTVRIMTTGHLITFQTGEHLITEVCCGVHQLLPQQGRLFSQTLDNSRTHRLAGSGAPIWESSFEMESVNPRLLVTVHQHVAQPREFEGLLNRFASSGRMPLGAISYVNLQAFRRHVNVMSFHTFPDTCSIVRVESRFAVPSSESV